MSKCCFSQGSGFQFCACVSGRISELADVVEERITAAGGLQAWASTILNHPEPAMAMEAEVDGSHIVYLKGTAHRNKGGTNKGRCVTGCEPTYKREMKDVVQSKLDQAKSEPVMEMA